MEKQKKQEIKIKAKDDDLKGIYSNMMQVSHNKEEFILDFFMVSLPQGVLVSRIIMNPSHLKRTINALQRNIAIYEDRFGKIKETETPERKIGFRTE